MAYKIEITYFLSLWQDKTVKLGDKDLLKLNLRQGNFWIDPCVENDSKLNKEQTMAPDSSSLEQDPWLVIKSFKTNANKVYIIFWRLFRIFIYRDINLMKEIWLNLGGLNIELEK